MKLLVAIPIAFLLSGCFVVEEIEKGRAIMEAHDGKDNDAEEAGDDADSKGPPKTPGERLAEYYAKQRAQAAAPTKSLNPADDVGAYRIGNNTQFMRRSDCKLRGGTFR
jgi:hypothetical protein